jgi:hypothetical protein
MSTPPMILTELTLRGAREPIYWPLERLTDHFGLCPGLEQDTQGEWHYVPRWWALCHTWIGEFDVPTARSILIVEQDLPPSDLIDRPSMALDPERVRTFAKWLEQQRDWSSRTASVDLSELSSEVREEIDRFYTSPNLWEIGARGALNPSRRRLGQAENS